MDNGISITVSSSMKEYCSTNSGNHQVLPIFTLLATVNMHKIHINTILKERKLYVRKQRLLLLVLIRLYRIISKAALAMRARVRLSNSVNVKPIWLNNSIQV